MLALVHVCPPHKLFCSSLLEQPRHGKQYQFLPTQSLIVKVHGLHQELHFPGHEQQQYLCSSSLEPSFCSLGAHYTTRQTL
nr:hypothetical protein Iba_chr07dCG10380 [Ipomoea batatas]